MTVFLIIDVSNLAYRSAFGNKLLQTTTGKFSGHVFGACSSLLSLYRNELSGYDSIKCVFCYDGMKSKDFRRSLLPEYKAKRIPHEFNPLPEVEAVLRFWPGIHIKQDDKEGDDAICFAAQMIQKQGGESIVFTGDKDLWHLTKLPKCKVMSPNLDKRFVVPEDVYKEYHLKDHPERIPLAKAVFGDSSDDIKGVFRLQKKSVEKYLNAPEVDTPEKFYQALGENKPEGITDSAWEKLLLFKDKVFLNFQVVLPQLDFEQSSVIKVCSKVNELKAKLVEYECFSLLNDVTKLLW